MNDTRVRIVNFILLSIAYSISSLSYVPLVVLSAFIVSLSFRNVFIKNLSIILISSMAILSIGIIAWFISPKLIISNLVLNYLRWISLIIISVIFFSSINLFEFVSSLAFFKIPIKIAIAFGIGIRFLPVLVDESRKVIRIQHQNGYNLSLLNIFKSGLINVFSKILSPILISILRKTDSITISVTVQQIEKRVKNYNFKTINIIDFIGLIFCILILSVIIINYDFDLLF